MHCPNCGIQTSIDQKFCRTCGMSLTAVAEAMVAHQAAAGSDTPLVENDKRENDKRALRRMGFGMFLAIVIMFIGAGVLGVNKRMFHSDLVWLLGLIMVLAGTIGAAYAVISPLWQQRSKPRKSTGDQRSAGLEGSVHTSPEGLPAPPPSITEQTTTRLEHEAAKPLSGDNSKTTGA